MIGYILIIIISCIITSIATEQMLIRRLKLAEGIQVKRGVCMLKDGYGKVDGNTTPPPVNNIGQIENVFQRAVN
jgi:hypothetical protein